jgi:hypothetical protein
MCPVIKTLTTKFQDVCRPKEALTIDEAICPFRGAICFHVGLDMKGEPHKYRINNF